MSSVKGYGHQPPTETTDQLADQASSDRYEVKIPNSMFSPLAPGRAGPPLNPTADTFTSKPVLLPSSKHTKISPTSTDFSSHSSTWTKVDTQSGGSPTTNITVGSNKSHQSSSNLSMGGSSDTTVDIFTHPRSGSVSSTNTTTSTSTSDKKIKPFGDGWLTSSHDEALRDMGLEVASGTDQGRQRSDSPSLLQATHGNCPHGDLPLPTPQIRRSRSPSMPILPSQLAHTPTTLGNDHVNLHIQYHQDYNHYHAPEQHDGRGPFPSFPLNRDAKPFLLGPLTTRPPVAQQRQNPGRLIEPILRRVSNFSSHSTTDSHDGGFPSPRWHRVPAKENHEASPSAQHIPNMPLPPLSHHASTPNFAHDGQTRQNTSAHVRFATDLNLDDATEAHPPLDLDGQEAQLVHAFEGAHLREHRGHGTGRRLESRSMPALANASKNKNIYIHSITEPWTEEELFAYGSKFGEVISAKIKRLGGDDHSHGQYPPQGERYCGFVLYRDAKDAANFLQFLRSKGRQADYAKEDFQTEWKALEDRESANLYIIGLPHTFTVVDLRKLLEPYGTVVSERILEDRGDRRGPILARLQTRAQAERAIAALNGVEIPGRQVRLGVRIADSEDQKVLKKKQSILARFNHQDMSLPQLRRASLPPTTIMSPTSPLDLKEQRLRAELQKIQAQREEQNRLWAAQEERVALGDAGARPTERTESRRVSFPASPSFGPPVLSPAPLAMGRHRNQSSNVSAYSALSHESSTPTPMTRSVSFNSDSSSIWVPQTPLSAGFRGMFSGWQEQQQQSQHHLSSPRMMGGGEACWGDSQGVWRKLQGKGDQGQYFRHQQGSGSDQSQAQGQPLALHHARSSPELKKELGSIPTSLLSELDHHQGA